MVLLDGKKIRDEIAARLAEQVAGLSVKPKLIIVQVGDNRESEAYIRQKKIFGEKIGAAVEHIRYPESTAQQELLGAIRDLNADESVHGIIVQLPLPKHLGKQELIDAIDARKDVDGLTPENTVGMWRGDGGMLPATARGILTLLDYYNIPVEGKMVAMIGKSLLVGKPIALALMNRNATVTVCHKHTADLKEHTRNADIIIAAAGAPRLITNDHINDSGQQVIIDVGITAVEEQGVRKIVGDVDFEAVAPHVAMITPVPGGVGPLTVASLFQNLQDAFLTLNKN